MSTAALAWQPPTSTSAIPVQQICPTSKGNFLVMFYSTAAFCVPLVSNCLLCYESTLFCSSHNSSLLSDTDARAFMKERQKKDNHNLSEFKRHILQSCIVCLPCRYMPNLCFALCSWKAEKIQHKWQNKGIRGYDTQIQWSVSFFPWNLKLSGT